MSSTGVILFGPLVPPMLWIIWRLGRCRWDSDDA